ncbi:CehA/McbA family metallohydrolase [Verrucomicrobiales bacterium]|nr:CehA/McbA family metallohydrolase [Verrucomicrobiales bacterium]MDB2642280.1 CehA/McbA family metallohydrolase [bacterium]MDC3353257.1 CehA/McbA family metallohydrolase [Verrucomicrobiales bacterium]
MSFLNPRILFFVVLFPGSIALGAEPLVFDPDFHHLRNAEPREWSHYPEEAESARLVSSFDVEKPESFRILTFRQEGTKQNWTISLNGQQLGRLPRDHNHLEHAIALPEGLLKAEENELVVETKSEKPDDIQIGDFALHHEKLNLVSAERAADLEKKRGYPRALPNLGFRVRLSAKASGEAIPCRFTIVDTETGALALIGAESDDRLAVREGIVYSIDGEATILLKRGRTYQVTCGRGFEYSIDQQTIDAGKEGEEASLEFSLMREVETPGWIACDPHLHTYEFDRHGDCDLTERLISCAGEGVELAISTGHDKHISYDEESSRIGVDKWMTSVTGCEVTTSLGHFNTFPNQASAKPVEHKLRTWPRIFSDIFATPDVRVCILNHGRDVHRNFTPLAPENFDVGKGTFTQDRELKANAMELINSGAQQTDPMQLVHDWFALLRSGHKITGIGSSDSHTVNFAIPGQGRTYLPVPDFDVGKIDVGAAIDSLLEGHGAVSFGLLSLLEILGDSVTVSVHGPSWTSVSEIVIYRNGESIRTIKHLGENLAGLKEEVVFSLEELQAKPGDFLCAVATGPGIADGWWRMMPPYQPDKPDYEPFVMGISPAVFVK